MVSSNRTNHGLERSPLVANDAGEVEPSDEQQRLASNILESMRTCSVPSISLNPNRTDIEENFLEEIEDSENIVRTFTTLKPKSLLINQSQFSEVAPYTSKMIRLQEQLNNSNLSTHKVKICLKLKVKLFLLLILIKSHAYIAQIFIQNEE